ncbi:unnamed protein product [Rotaria sordida]|uniref:Uncharacterized protein n=1 Tax=Rotaria sordida TaxID=392033 RepID=A0A818JE43_9BILA|nr:unnamed protein product [Rotaria sordida]CAF0816805.1 unnamed protein product [Rotaria sordida]CAF3534408.1 unnamed protein product [Rotaria sordida]CAF3968246.1 unnamed protein product [Rotaria sordida]
MKLLSESARTTQTFLKIAKDEEELQEENVPGPEPTAPYVPYSANIVSTTLKQTDDIHSNVSKHPYSSRTTTPHESETTTTIYYEDVSDDEEIINHGNDQEPMNLSSFDDIEDHVEIYAPSEILTLNDDNIHSEPMGNILTRVHSFSLPEIIKVYLPHKPRHSNEHETYQEQLFNYNDDEGVHARDKSSNEIESIADDDIIQNTTVNQRQQNR